MPARACIQNQHTTAGAWFVNSLYLRPGIGVDSLRARDGDAREGLPGQKIPLGRTEMAAHFIMEGSGRRLPSAITFSRWLQGWFTCGVVTEQALLCSPYAEE